MYKTEINETGDQTIFTLKQLQNNEFDLTSVAYDSDGEATFLMVPAMNEDYQNSLIYIADGGFEAVDFDSWSEDELYSLKEVTDLCLKLTV